MSKNREIQLSEILKKTPNRFLLSLAIAKRARQLNEGAKPLIEISETEPFHPILTALEEIYQNKISIQLENNRDENMELIEEVERYFEEVPTPAIEQEESPKKAKKEKGEKDKHKSKTKSLSA